MYLPLKIDFIVANSADPDEMPHPVAFHFTACQSMNVIVYGLPLHKGFKLLKQLKLLLTFFFFSTKIIK